MTTTRLSALATLVVGLLLVAGPGAQTRLMSIDEAEAGHGRRRPDGVCRHQARRLQGRILGVLRNVIAPKRNLILARLEGGPLAKTGVIAGMSGSPVYVDGKLIGAVSYALGQFSTEPIAGITPIAEMIDATTDAARRDRPRARWRCRCRSTPARAAWRLVARSGRSRSPRRRCRRRRWSVRRSADLPDERDAAADRGADDRERLRCGGARSAGRRVRASGFLPMTGQSPTPTPVVRRQAAHPRSPATRSAWPCSPATSNSAPPAPSRTSTAIASMPSAIPLYNLGPTEFPMTRAEVQVVLPSLMSSSKLASFGAVVGTVQQDRATAIAGRLGPAPSLIPVTVTLNSDRAPSRTFNFGVVRDFTFTPLLTYLAVANVLTVVRARRRTGLVHHSRQRQHSLRRRPGLRRHLQRRSASRRRGRLRRRAADGVAQEHGRERRRREDRADDRRQRAAAQSARIERVWLDTTRPRAGQNPPS